MHLLLPLAILATTVVAGFNGCSSDPNLIPTAPETLPRLEQPLTLGLTRYGGAEWPAAETPERALLDAAVADGMRGFAYYVDWADLEPTPQNYTLTEFTATLDALQARGIQPLVNITVGDIDDYNLPASLSDGAGGLADGVALDDPAVLTRFGALLDRVVPVLLARGGFYLGVGNEVDARFEEEYPGELDAYVRFVAAARQRVRRHTLDLAVGVTLTKQAIVGQTRTFAELRNVTDIIPFNYAPIALDFLVLPREQVLSDFRAVLAAYGDGPVMIQELTCPSAATMGASTTWQRDAFQLLFDEIAATPRIRFVTVFTFADFDAVTCEQVREALFGGELDGLPADLAERLGDYLCELGLVYADGTPKPAWENFRAALRAAAP